MNASGTSAVRLLCGEGEPTAIHLVNSRLISAIALTLSCAGSSPRADGATEAPTPQVGVETATVRVRSANARLEAFVPRGQLVLEGGECTVFALPREGVRRLNLVYPSRGEPKSAITIVVDQAGQVLHYVENRGLAGAMTRDGVPVDAAAFNAPRTTIQLDYVTGEALLVNRGGGEPDEMIRATTSELQGHERLGDFSTRAKAVFDQCG